MRASHLLTLVLLLSIGAGPALLDRCLFGCDEDPSAQSAVPPCHEESAPAAVLSVHAAHACGHDHDALLADTLQSPKAGRSRLLDMSGPMGSALTNEPSRRLTPLASPGMDSPPGPRAALILQLRV